ncbi:MAG: 3-hydroxyacyl-CoA dehydrogenase NAD-binding domain-containing protein [Rhodothermales bacterium]
MIVGIVGCGTMGIGIAQVAATAGNTVVVFDKEQEILLAAKDKLGQRFARLVEKERLTPAQADACIERIRFSNGLSDMASADLVIEAIIEHVEIKQALFVSLEAVVSDQCVLASNTSSLPIASIAAACQHPERVIGLHFFNPAPVMKLVEIIPAVQTRPGLTGEMKDLMKAWKKVPVIAKDTPAFIVNRIARPFYGEALRMLEEGIADAATIDWAMKTLAGFRMGPFELMDFIGQDINYKVTNTVFEAFFYDPRYKPSFTQKSLVEAGYLGRKAGRGFYRYGADAETVEPNRDEVLGKQIVRRIGAMLINEAVDALFWQVATAEDIELAMTKGVNYPKGLLQWADEWGLDDVLQLLDALYEEYREDRYRASPLLRRNAKAGVPLLASPAESTHTNEHVI